MKIAIGYRTWSIVAGVIWAATAHWTAAGQPDSRRVIPLDGDWEIGEGQMDAAPGRFGRTVPVPGLVDMARPAFTEVGVESRLREAFWYRRTFRVEGPLPAVAILKVHKAMFGTRVVLNGTVLGDHLPCFTPGLFDARNALRAGENEVLIRVGAGREAVPQACPLRLGL